MRLTLIRHGQTPSNVTGLLDTAPPGPGLTEMGRKQAEAIPRALRVDPVQAVFSSDQLRAQQTASPLADARGLEVVSLPGLREISAGDLEMAGDAQSIHRYISTLWGWLEGDLRRRIPGGPDGVETLERYDAAIAEIVSDVGPGGSVVAVSHGAAIRVWTALRAVNLGGDFGQYNHLGNTAAVVLEAADGRDWHMVSYTSEALGGRRLTTTLPR